MKGINGHDGLTKGKRDMVYPGEHVNGEGETIVIDLLLLDLNAPTRSQTTHVVLVPDLPAPSEHDYNRRISPKMTITKSV